MRFHGNNCNILSILRIMTLLFVISHLWDFISILLLFSYIYISNLRVLYILPFKQNFLCKLILQMLSAILAFYVRTNHLSRKKILNSSIPKNSNSYRIRVLLSSKREKRRITKVKNIIVFVSIAAISLPIYPLISKLSVIISWLADCLSTVYTFQSSSIWEPQVQVKVWVLKFYKRYLKKFSNLSVKASTFRIIKLSTKDFFFIKVDLFTTATK